MLTHLGRGICITGMFARCIQVVRCSRQVSIFHPSLYRSLTYNGRLAVNNDWPAEEGWALYLVTLLEKCICIYNFG